MYNSIIINLIMAVVIRTQSLYRYSLIHKIVTDIKGFCKKTYQNSVLIAVLKKLSTYYENSLIIKLTTKILSFGNTVLRGLFKVTKALFKNTNIKRSLSYYTKSISNLMELVFSIMIVSALIMRILYEKGNLVMDTRIIVVSAVAGVVGLILVNLNRHIVANSKIVQYLLSLYQLDEGGHTWW